jgi:hypothetical protein
MSFHLICVTGGAETCCDRVMGSSLQERPAQRFNRLFRPRVRNSADIDLSIHRHKNLNILISELLMKHRGVID